ncbi:hypothetical protein [Sporosarcina obsidiansis]|uniref:hypothetical protein n=1 Tax=Sporosarcina obsidiansis TaxID=2660748 RepID=UPI00129B0E45|nr:hypothetical protein [Sporosarcina obsidiansis]
MIAFNYGKYQVYTKLIQLIKLQEALNNERLLHYGDLLGYYFSLEWLDSRYLFHSSCLKLGFARSR